MIPTFRSILAATLLTMMALVGGFGLFAAFRVNHEPLGRLQTAVMPFERVTTGALPLALGFASVPSFDSRLESTAGLVAIAAVSNTATAVDPTGVVADPGTDSSAPSTAASDVGPQVDTALSTASLPGGSKGNDTSRPAVMAEANPNSNTAQAPQSTPAVESQPQTAAVGTPSDQEKTQADAVTAAAGQSSQPQDMTTPIASSSSASEPGWPNTMATSAPAAPEKAAPGDGRDTAQEVARRKRLAAARRARRERALAAAQSADQNSLFPQTNFQPTSQTQQPAQQQQAMGGPFIPAPAPAKTKPHRQN